MKIDRETPRRLFPFRSAAERARNSDVVTRLRAADTGSERSARSSGGNRLACVRHSE